HARVGRHDGFFQLGGHSLLAAKLVAQIRKEWGRNLPLKGVFETPELARLAERIDAAQPVPAPKNIILADRAAPLPASGMQTMLWQWQKEHPESGAYNICGAARLKGPLDVGMLRACFAYLVERHEALRTLVREGPDGLEQVICEAEPLAFAVIDLMELEPWAALARAAELAHEQASRPFDLGREMPIRIHLTRLGDEDWVFTLTLNHAFADGLSMGILGEEIQSVYQALILGVEPHLPATLQLADYAAWRRQRDRDPEIQRRLRLACAALPSAWCTHPLRPDRPRERAGTTGARLRFQIPKEAIAAVRRHAAENGATLAMATLTALGITLGKRADWAAIGIGLVSADRELPEFQRVFGCLLETEFAIVQGAPQQSFLDVLTAVREERLASQARGTVPFRRMTAALEADGRLEPGAPPYQISFSYLGRGFDGRNIIPGVEASAFAVENAFEVFELAFDFNERPEGSLHVSMGYRREIFAASTIEGVAADFRRTLIAAATDPSQPLGRLAGFDPSEALNNVGA
ncbi:Phosphopantetheine attachment site, partial [Arboricoccus pini]